MPVLAMANFKKIDRESSYLMPPSLQDWLPENHLARFVVDIVDRLDLSLFRAAYGSGGSAAYDPAILLGMLFYGYATGIFSSRLLEKASYDSVAMRFICGNTHPDHDTIASFRRRFLPEISRCFVRILELAREMGTLHLGNVSIDGTKIKANASKHSAMSFGHMEKLDERLAQEAERLLKMAEGVDATDAGTLDIPQELEDRQARRAKLDAAKKVIEERARQRDHARQEEYEQKLKRRRAKEKESGKKAGGKEPMPPKKGPRPKDQYNFTDPESRIMKTGSGFEQCYNAQAAVDQDSMLIVGHHLSDSPNDKRELIPVLDAVPEEIGTVAGVAADAGYFSEDNIRATEKRGVEAYIAPGRQPHNPGLDQILHGLDRPHLSQADTRGLSPVDAMKVRLNTLEGHAVYRLRKCTVEPVFGIIKQAMGLRQFLTRGLRNVQGEWCLLCCAYNLRRLHSLKTA